MDFKEDQEFEDLSDSSSPKSSKDNQTISISSNHNEQKKNKINSHPESSDELVNEISEKEGNSGDKQEDIRQECVCIDPAEFSELTSLYSDGFTPYIPSKQSSSPDSGTTPTVFNIVTEEQRKIKLAKLIEEINKGDSYYCEYSKEYYSTTDYQDIYTFYLK